MLKEILSSEDGLTLRRDAERGAHAGGSSSNPGRPSGDGGSHERDISEGEVTGNDPAPARCAKFDGIHVRRIEMLLSQKS